MDQIATTILSSGRSAVELALFILLPIMIVMLSIMRWLEARGLLHRIVRVVSPLLRPFGLTGLGVFALIQVSMVSFAAPIATLAIMARNGSSPRHIAGGTAMMGIAMEQMQLGLLSAQDINLLAGLLLCPLDVAGVAILIAAGKPVAAVVRPAIYGALIGIALRTAGHFWLFT